MQAEHRQQTAHGLLHSGGRLTQETVHHSQQAGDGGATETEMVCGKQTRGERAVRGDYCSAPKVFTIIPGSDTQPMREVGNTP